MFSSLLRSILPMCQCHWYCCVLVSGLEATDVRSVVDLGFSLHVINMSQCVDALIWGNDVAVMLATIKGHLKVIVYQGENISLNRLTVLISVCSSVRLSVRPSAHPSVCLSVITRKCPWSYASTLCICVCMATWREGQGHCHSPLTNLPIIHPLCIWGRAITLNHFWSTQE